MKYLKGIETLIIILVILSIPALLSISDRITQKINTPKYYNYLFEEAQIMEIISEQLNNDYIIPNLLIGKQTVRVKILTGKYKDKTYESVNLLSRSHNVHTIPDMKVIVGIREVDDQQKIWVYNHKRDNYLYALSAIFIALLFILGRTKGLRAALALVFTGSMFIFIMVPLIFSGYNPYLVSILCSMITVVISFIVISGISLKSFSAITGTILGITIAGIISFSFGSLVHLSGVNMDKGEQLVNIAGAYRIQVKGLMFASILIASLGAIMDVTMSIASAIQEIHVTDKSLSRKELFGSGISIGKDIMGTMSNTLILAFMGGSLSLILLLWGYQMEFRQLINMPFMSLEIIQGLAGSIGIVLAVPLTALISAWLMKIDTP